MKVDNASTFGGIETGVNVDIKRSDGRIHSAIVTELKFESRTVSVEWFENNETKGKWQDHNFLALSSFCVVCVFIVRERGEE